MKIQMNNTTPLSSFHIVDSIDEMKSLIYSNGDYIYVQDNNVWYVNLNKQFIQILDADNEYDLKSRFRQEKIKSILGNI